MALISTIVVFFRIYVQCSEISFGWDDGLMLAALVVYIANIGLACRSAQYNVSTPDVNLPISMHVEGSKYMTLWSLLYSLCLFIIKASICLTIFRLRKPTRYIRFAIYILLLASFGSFLDGVIGLLTQCNPVEAIWDKRLLVDGRATCKDKDNMLVIIYTTAIITVATDVACTVLPAVMMWNTQLKLKKLLISLLLLFGLLASVCTVIRVSDIKQFTGDGIHFWTLRTVLWSNIETAIGIIAGSMPVLQKIFLSQPKTREPITSSKAPGSAPSHSAPIKSQSNREDFSNPFDTGCNITTVSASRRSRDWDRMKGRFNLPFIRAEYTYEVTRSGFSAETAEMKV
ncbi:hypothetical protein F4813DRAFT_393708 [Daldinia decipiens]|uniref:uncharacterized protein n=1 Tax=Daldinia decipiens TaxID=326647 RepID=UPI0020C25274|nr:uncharacterized protein F4813DRAFT_393708 [Daldinia decipiens]KAI1653393.1 hypothetical protein F4813DRAFT_393708 [Daldinia decipiens]